MLNFETIRDAMQKADAGLLGYPIRLSKQSMNIIFHQEQHRLLGEWPVNVEGWPLKAIIEEAKQ